MKKEKNNYIYDSSVNSMINGEDRLSQLATLQPPTMQQIINMNSATTYAATLSIPELKKELAVSNDTSTSAFLAGVVNMYPTRDYSTDNIVLLGHHLADSGLLLGDIDRLRKNDQLILTSLHNKYYYKVSDIYITNEKNVEVLMNTSQAQLTLITCDKPSYTQNRLVLEATMINKEDLEKNYRFKTELLSLGSRHSHSIRNKNVLFISIIVYSMVVVLLIKVFLIDKQ